MVSACASSRYQAHSLRKCGLGSRLCHLLNEAPHTHTFHACGTTGHAQPSHCTMPFHESGFMQHKAHRCQLSRIGRDCLRFSSPVPCPERKLLFTSDIPDFQSSRLLLLSWVTKLQKALLLESSNKEQQQL